MALFGKRLEEGMYHATNNAADWALQAASTEQIQTWASDPNCVEQAKCAAYLPMRLQREADERAANEARDTEKLRLAEEARLANSRRKEQLDTFPFDPRSEISADAKHIAGRIVTALWIIFVLLPVVLSILYELMK